MSSFAEVEKKLLDEGYEYHYDLCAWVRGKAKDGYGNDLHFLFPPFGITDEKLHEIIIKERSIC